MNSRLIFTAADPSFWELFSEMFYPTLRQYGRYGDDVKVILFGTHPEHRIRRFVDAGIALPTAKDLNLNQIWKFEYAAEFQEQYQEVYYYDCDIWFMAEIQPLFDLAEEGVLLACEIARDHCVSDFFSKQGFNERNAMTVSSHLSSGFQRSIIGGLAGRPIINGGFFGGTELGRTYRRILSFSKCWREIGFGFDQTILNLWAYYFPGYVKRVHPRYNTSLMFPSPTLRADECFRLFLGPEVVVAAHANTARSAKEKMAHPYFQSFVQHWRKAEVWQDMRTAGRITNP